MEDSILSFLGEGGKLILSISCSAIISPYDITLNSPPKTPQRISQENHKKNLFFHRIQTNGKVQLQLQLHSLSGPH